MCSGAALINGVGPYNGDDLPHEKLLGISVLDSVVSTALAFGPLPMPRDFPLDLGQRGTTGTCTLQAFMLQVGCGSVVYNAMLMFHYFLVICCGVREKRMASVFEPFMHLFPISYYLGTAFIGIAWGVFNPTGGFCWVADHPIGCSDDPDTECVRGGVRTHTFGLYLLAIPLLIWTCFLAFFILSVGFIVWWRYHRSKRFQTEDNIHVNDNEAAEKRTRLVLVQCFLYFFTFFNMMIWSTMGTIADLIDAEAFYRKNFWLQGMSVFFFPIQGLFNFLIYIRPRYLSNRTRHKDRSRWFSLQEAVWNPVATPTSSGPRRSSEAPQGHGSGSGLILSWIRRKNGPAKPEDAESAPIEQHEGASLSP